MKITNSLLILFLICSFNNAISQENKAKLIIGACASQIHGDQLGGYNKLGYTLGISVERELQNNLIFQPEILYNRRGSSTSTNDIQSYSITLKYLDIPILLGYNLNELFNIQGGISIGRLISSTKSFGGGISYNNIKDYDSRIMGGIEYKALEKLSLKMRYAISIVNIGKIGNLQNDSIDFLLLFYLN